jgi:hypothetical protein
MFLSERNFRPIRREVFRPKSRVSPRCVTAGRTLERRHCLPGLHQHRVEVTAVSALPSDLHRQFDDRRGDLRQCLNALCPEFRFGHGGLSRFGFEWCHASSGAVRTVCMLAGAAIVQNARAAARMPLFLRRPPLCATVSLSTKIRDCTRMISSWRARSTAWPIGQVRHQPELRLTLRDADGLVATGGPSPTARTNSG